jgi:hypothetical protein
MPARFCRFTRQEFEDFLRVGPDGKPLEKGGFFLTPVYGTVELVYSKIIHRDANGYADMSLRIYSTIEGGLAREKGADALRLRYAWRPSPAEQTHWEKLGLARPNSVGQSPVWPKNVGDIIRVFRTTNWRDNLGKQIEHASLSLPKPCACGCPTMLMTPPKGKTWEPFWTCVWKRDCPAKGGNQ